MKAFFLLCLSTFFLGIKLSLSQVPGKNPKSGTMTVRKHKKEAQTVETRELIKEKNLPPIQVFPVKKGKRSFIK